jgi:hypothetical protein
MSFHTVWAHLDELAESLDILARNTLPGVILLPHERDRAGILDEKAGERALAEVRVLGGEAEH